jgi:hypothetical protein
MANGWFTNSIPSPTPNAPRRAAPHPRPDLAILRQSEGIFGYRTGFATLNRLLARQRANKGELLKVLDRPDIPLHKDLPISSGEIESAHRYIAQQRLKRPEPDGA